MYAPFGSRFLARTLLIMQTVWEQKLEPTIQWRTAYLHGWTFSNQMCSCAVAWGIEFTEMTLTHEHRLASFPGSPAPEPEHVGRAWWYLFSHGRGGIAAPARRPIAETPHQPPVHMPESSFICSGLTTFEMPARHGYDVIEGARIFQSWRQHFTHCSANYTLSV